MLISKVDTLRARNPIISYKGWQSPRETGQLQGFHKLCCSNLGTASLSVGKHQGQNHPIFTAIYRTPSLLISTILLLSTHNPSHLNGNPLTMSDLLRGLPVFYPIEMIHGGRLPIHQALVEGEVNVFELVSAAISPALRLFVGKRSFSLTLFLFDLPLQQVFFNEKTNVFHRTNGIASHQCRLCSGLSSSLSMKLPSSYTSKCFAHGGGVKYSP